MEPSAAGTINHQLLDARMSCTLIRQAEWLRHYATSRKVVGSRPDEENYVILPAALRP
jgi:hypothetical protein